MRCFGVVGAAAIISALAVVCVPESALAQGAPPASATPPAPAAPPAAAQPGAGGSTEAKMEEARLRYQRGLQLFNEANYDAARVEFERAYQLAPSYKILYNIGLSYEQLGDYVQAQTTLERYLEQGRAEITEERRSEVAKELAQIRPRIARVRVTSNVAGAEVLVDDICGTDASTATVNCGPLVGNSREVLMNPGRRRVTVRHEGYLPETQSITVAGSDRLDLNVDLKALPKGYVEKKSNPFVIPMWVGWGLTGAGAITATITGIIAANDSKDQQNATSRLGVTHSEILDARLKTRTMATVTDVTLIGTGVFALAATYFTYRAVKWKGESGDVNVQVGLGNVSAAGHF